MGIKLSTPHMTDASQPKESFAEANSLRNLGILESEERHFDHSLVTTLEKTSKFIDDQLLIAVFGE